MSVVRYALVWQDVMNKYGVSSLFVAQYFVYYPNMFLNPTIIKLPGVS